MSDAASSTTAPATKRTSYLELFFDLVFVFAITQLARTLLSDHSASGWYHAALLAWLVWWAWSQYAWAGNAVDLEGRGPRLAVLGATGAMLLAAAAIPEAFGSEGLRFAIPYALVRFGGLAIYWAGLRGNDDHRAALWTFLPIASISPVLVLVGGAASASARPWIWLAAVLVDIASTISAQRGEFRISPTHFAERHALIVIIALGESVIAVGAATSDLAPTAARTATAVVAFVVVAALWWAYFGWVSQAAEDRLERATEHRDRSHLARDLFTYGHFPIVMGIVLFAIGVEEALLLPRHPLDGFGQLAVAGGLTLFLGGFIVGNLRATGQVLVERTVGTVALILLVALAGDEVNALALLAVIAATVVAITALEGRRRFAT
jgi:low temperature requirement protein LtrA